MTHKTSNHRRTHIANVVFRRRESRLSELPVDWELCSPILSSILTLYFMLILERNLRRQIIPHSAGTCADYLMAESRAIEATMILFGALRPEQ